MKPSDTRHEEIAWVAFHIYESEGRPDGKSAEHWARAERAIHEQRISIPPHSPKQEATDRNL